MDCEILRIFVLIVVFSCYLCGISAQFSECETDANCVNITESVCISYNCSCLASDVRVGYTCLYDCGSPQIPINGNLSKIDGMLQGDIAIYECDAGFRLVGNTETMCARGGWDTVPPSCERGNLGDDCAIKPDVCDNLENAECDGITCECIEGFEQATQHCINVDCGILRDNQNGSVNIIDGTEYNDTVIYSCSDGFLLVGDKIRRCLKTGQWSGIEPSCVKNDSDITKCDTDTDSRGTVWTEVISGNTRVEACAEGFLGNATRTCQDDGKWKRPQYNCIRESVQTINSIVANLDMNVTGDIVGDVLTDIRSVTTPIDDTEGQEKLTDGELRVLSSALHRVAEALTSSVNILNDNITNDFIETTSNLIGNSNQESWKSLSGSAVVEQMLKAVDLLGEALSKTLNSSEEKRVIVKENIALEVKKFANMDVIFPDLESTENVDQEVRWIRESQSSLRLDSISITDAGNGSGFVTTAIMYRDLSEILPPTKRNDSKSVDAETDEEYEAVINAPVLALTILPTITKKLASPVKITFGHTRKNLTTPSCVFWKFQSGSNGFWSTEGCKLISTNENVSTCECDHVTNFAILMSPFREADASSKALRVISVVGIGVSIAFLLVTTGVYFMLWKYLRNDRTTVLMHLCTALLISYILFLSGVDRTESSAACSAIAAILQYIYLVVFCIMLVEGIDIAIKVVYVFYSKSRIRHLLVLAWVIPAVTVGISLGASNVEGYGNDNFCWLSVDNGLIWAFVAPALLIITLNGICLVVVFHTMFKSKAMEVKKIFHKIKTSFWSLCVLVPVMGVSWVIGIFYINDSFYFIQYIFAILNGLQGFFIFLFHCLLNAQVKKALNQLKRRLKIKSTFKRLSKEDRNIKDSRGTGHSYMNSGFEEQYASHAWREMALHTNLGFSQGALQLAKPIASKYDAWRHSATFSAASRDRLTGDRSLSYPEYVRGLSNHLEEQ